jgi:hypothetical protein
MPRKPKTGSGWFAFLEQNGLLGADSSALINARRVFHTQWKRAWREKQKNKGVKYYKPQFSASDNQRLIKTAKEYGIHPTQYIQQATISHLDNTPLLPNWELFRRIIQVLYLINNELTEQSGASSFSLHDELQTMKARLTIIEDWIKQLYYTPPTVPQILIEALQRHPNLLPEIKAILDASSQKHEPENTII